MRIALKKRHRSRQQNGEKKPLQFALALKRLVQGLSCVLIFFTVGYFVFWCLEPAHFPISSVRFIGERKYLSQDELKEVISSEIKKGFFRLKVSTLQQQLLSLTWIARVDVRKVWPNQLVINFEEHQPAALWRGEAVLSVMGVLFYPDIAKVKRLNLPVLQGPEGKSDLVWRQFLVMEETLAPLQLNITQLTLAPRGAWHLRLSNGITVVLGTNDVMMRLHRFARAYEKQLHVRQKEMTYVDLRYTSGMAVGWRSG